MVDSSNAMTSVNNKNTCVMDMEPQSPSAWFAANPGAKPTVEIPESEYSVNVLRQAVFLCATSGQAVAVDVMLEYLYHCLKQMTATVSKEWKSYGLVIGNSGDKITPLNLIQVRRVATRAIDLKTEHTGDAADKDDKWLCLWILAIYRLRRATHQNYQQKLINMINNRIKILGAPDSADIHKARNRCKSWLANTTYKQLVACIDMFFYRAVTSDWAILRVGTIGSRYRDCSSLLAFASNCRRMGLTKNCTDLFSWMYEKTLISEADSLFNSDDEYFQHHSYFPYHMDLGLCSKSAYSSRSMPAIHFFSNIIGVMLGNENCKNARMVLDKEITNVLNNARWVGYVFRYSDLQTERKEKAGPNRPITVQPSDRDPEKWSTYYDFRGGEPDQEMMATFRHIKGYATSVRPGSIGEYLKENLI